MKEYNSSLVWGQIINMSSMHLHQIKGIRGYLDRKSRSNLSMKIIGVPEVELRFFPFQMKCGVDNWNLLYNVDGRAFGISSFSSHFVR